MEFVFIKNGIVEGVYVYAETPMVDGYTIIDTSTITGQTPGPGWTYADDEFTALPTVSPKSIYTRTEFLQMIPKGKVRQIQTAAATNDDINVWAFLLPMITEIDLNDLPQWFLDGIAAFVSEGIITQNQANAFLEI